MRSQSRSSSFSQISSDASQATPGHFPQSVCMKYLLITGTPFSPFAYIIFYRRKKLAVYTHGRRDTGVCVLLVRRLLPSNQQRTRALNKPVIIMSTAVAAVTVKMEPQPISPPLLSGTPARTTSTRPQPLLQSFL